MTDISAIGPKELINGEANNFKMGYLMIFMRVLVAVSVRWYRFRSKNGYAWSS